MFPCGSCYQRCCVCRDHCRFNIVTDAVINEGVLRRLWLVAAFLPTCLVLVMCLVVPRRLIVVPRRLIDCLCSQRRIHPALQLRVYPG